MFGQYYTNFELPADADFLFNYTLGTQEDPVIIKSDANVNGTKVVATPTVPGDLVGDTTGRGEGLEEVLTIANVVVQ